MLGESIAQARARVWLVNTGWTGGPYGIGRRMKIAHTRAMIRAALSGALDGRRLSGRPVFNLDIPTSCPDVPAEVLKPRNTWSDHAAYDAQAGSWRRCSPRTSRRSRTVDAKVRAAGPNA